MSVIERDLCRLAIMLCKSFGRQLGQFPRPKGLKAPKPNGDPWKNSQDKKPQYPFAIRFRPYLTHSTHKPILDRAGPRNARKMYGSAIQCYKWALVSGSVSGRKFTACLGGAKAGVPSFPRTRTKIMRGTVVLVLGILLSTQAPNAKPQTPSPRPLGLQRENIDKVHQTQTACILFIYVYYKFYIHIIT